MAAYLIRPQAKTDLLEIWWYAADRWGPEQADIYTDLLTAAFDTIAQRVVSRLPPPRTAFDIQEGLYRFSVGSHVIFYTIPDDCRPAIETILHGAADFDAHF